MELQPNKPKYEPPSITLAPKKTKMVKEIKKSLRFLMAVDIEFLALVEPASKAVKPGCIRATKTALKSTHKMSMGFSLINI